MKKAVVLVAGLAAAAALAAEWMRAPGWILAAGVLAAAVMSLAAARRLAGSGALPRSLTWSGPVAALVLAVALLAATRSLDNVRRDWARTREALVTGASRQLGAELDAAVRLARDLADRTAAARALPPSLAFTTLARLTDRAGPSHGVVLFDSTGQARAWAGIQRAGITAAGPDLSAVTTPFYLWLVARRQTSTGTAAAAVLLARADAVPRAGDALTDRFADRTGVGLRFLPARAAPADSDVFDYVRPGGGDTLFAVQPVPPAQQEVLDQRLGDARRFAAVLVLLVLAAACACGLRIAPGLLLVAAVSGAVVIARAPLHAAFADGSLLWSATYAQRLLGPYSASAGALLLAGIVAFVLACALWHRGVAVSRAGRVVAVIVALVAPYTLQRLARGILPPASGVTLGLWLSWQIALVVAASALMLFAAALVRGPTAPRHSGRWPFVASGIAIIAATLGLWLWQPYTAWPEWYPYLWTPAVLLVLRPMPSRGTVAAIALVAGSSAALLTWGATTEGRMGLAARDLLGLGVQVEPIALARLDRVAHRTEAAFAPHSAGDLFVYWRRSELGVQGYPASLTLWKANGDRDVGLDLAELDIPADVLQRVAHEADSLDVPLVRPVLRVPGLHGVAAVPLADGRVLTVAVGPRSELVVLSRVARFLLGAAADPDPPYDIALAPPDRVSNAGSDVTWRREGWRLRGERAVALPDGVRHAHATVDLRGPAALLQRGVLLLVLDIVVLIGLWLLVELAAGRALPAARAWWPRGHRSLRLRLAATLTVFFLIPTIAIAAWSFGRLEDEFRSARELLLQRTLRDAAAAMVAGGSHDVADAARRVDAELVLAEDGAMASVSAPVLADLGLVDLLMPGEAYRRLKYGDEIEVASDQEASPTPTLVGYRLVSRSDQGRSIILGAPELLSDRPLRRREADLGMAVLVAVVAGILAALLLAGRAARALAEPLQQLRRAALAVGSGVRPDLVPDSVPLELEPIGGALTQAAEQVEAGQRAQRVLAWGEMARQVAHEIKNPLTPIRLGVQHLLRLFKERPEDLESVLPQTGERILAEIDRLDAIARAFSRFALPGAEGVPVEVVDLAAVMRDVVQLYRMGEGTTRWDSEAADATRALARRDELVEVLVNLCENARDAGASRVLIAARGEDGRVVLEVRDDGRGIPADVLPRIFEPRFSTNTSGSGLGLAIAKRLVESWGGTIGVVPGNGPGTTVRIELRPDR